MSSHYRTLSPSNPTLIRASPHLIWTRTAKLWNQRLGSRRSRLEFHLRDCGDRDAKGQQQQPRGSDEGGQGRQDADVH